MSHKALRLLIRDTAKSLADNIKFGYGRGSDFNLIKDKAYPYIWLDPMTATSDLTNGFSKTWNLNLAFYKMDSADSIEEQYQLILDEMDELVDRFLVKLNISLIDTINLSETDFTVDDLEIVVSSAQAPFIKIMTDYLTGYTIGLDITVPDKFDYCSLYDS